MENWYYGINSQPLMSARGLCISACCTCGVARLVYTSTYNVVFGGQVIINGNESLPYLPLHQVTVRLDLSHTQYCYRDDVNMYVRRFLLDPAKCIECLQ